MRLSRKLLTEVNRACAEACGGRRLVEPGEWWFAQPDGANVTTLNHLYDCNLGGDLDTNFSLRSLTGSTVEANAPNAPGWVLLDCYCYTYGRDGELDDNVAVLIDPAGRIRYSANVSRTNYAEIRRIIAAELAAT